MISVKKLTKSFGSVKAVDNLSFEIKKGQIVGFLGPNGAGKTTTMRLLTGFLSPDTGNISIDGLKLEKNLHQSQQKIGYLPENNPLYKDMLVSELLQTAADLKKIPKDKQKSAFDFVVKSVAIDDVFFRPIRELSKGYKQRVGMAIALLHKPQILIMDEPTEGLDPNQRTEIRSLIKELAKDRTIIISTHVMAEATAISNRILIINRGKVVADDSPDNLTKTGKGKRLFHLELEGTKIKSELESLKQLTDLQVDKIKGSKYQISFAISEKSAIQPEISRLAAKNKWIIWKLVEKESNLEDIFHELTK